MTSNQSKKNLPTRALQKKILQLPLEKKVEIELPPPSKRTPYESVRAFFLNSETIFLARVQILLGFLSTAVVGMNFSPLLALGVDTGFTNKQVYLIGSIVVISGLSTELARRINTTVIK